MIGERFIRSRFRGDSMRRTFWLLAALLAGAYATDALAQRPGGGGGGGPGGGGGGGFGGGRGGFGGGQMDPDALWKQMSGGAETIDLNRAPQMKWMLGGAPAPADGIITKQMYQTFMAQKMAGGGRGPGGSTPPAATPVPGSGAPVVIAVGSGSGNGDKPIVIGAPGGMQPGGGYAGGGFPSGGGGGYGGGGGRGGNMWGDPESLFQRIDKDKNGKITKDETQMLLPIFDQIDTNKDGSIDLAELKAYAATQAAASPGGGGGWGGNPGGGGEQPRNQEVEEERPVVYRFGKLPKDFPYAGLDKDEDGQVSLYEWRTSGKSVDDFLDRDLNGDGFLTAEEWLRGTKTSLGGGDTSKDKSKNISGGGGGSGFPGNMGGGRPGGGGRFGGGDPTANSTKDDKKDEKKDGGKRSKN